MTEHLNSDSQASMYIAYTQFRICVWSDTEKALAPHSSALAWKIPWTEEPGGLQSMGSLRVGPDWATSLSLFTFMHCRRKWQPTPMFLPGESQGQRSLVGRLPSMGSHRVRHYWSDLAAAAAAWSNKFLSFWGSRIVGKIQESTVLKEPQAN